MALAVPRTNPPEAEGVTPPRQARGLRTEQALLDAGRELLRGRHFDALRIEEICAAAGLTTGAFYRRFASKDAYLRYLQAAAAAEAEAALAEIHAKISRHPGDALQQLGVFTAGMIAWCRTHEGVLKASLQRASQEPQAWAPFRRIPRLVLGCLSKSLRNSLPARQATARALSAAYQIAAGTVINMLINDPGPMRLRDRGLAPELARAMLGYLQMETSK